MRALERIKPAVRNFQLDAGRGLRAAVKLDQNESAYDFPAELKAEVLAVVAAGIWARYPEPRPSALAAALSRHVGWPEEGVLVGNGSNELIQAILTAVCGCGRSLVTASPGFPLYRVQARFLDADVHEVPLAAGFRFDAGAIRREAERVGAGLIVICSPNNPTGSTIATAELEEILDGCSGLVVVDEAYREFGGTDFLALLRRYENLLLLRTFSKAMCLAGLRVGYLLGHRAVVAEIEKVKVPYSVDLFSCAAALVALKHMDVWQRRVRAVISERERVLDRLREMTWVRPYPSAGNFILFDLNGDRRQVFRGLLARGVLVRDVGRSGPLARSLRVTIGTPAENDRFLEALRAVGSSPGAGAAPAGAEAGETGGTAEDASSH